MPGECFAESGCLTLQKVAGILFGEQNVVGITPPVHVNSGVEPREPVLYGQE